MPELTPELEAMMHARSLYMGIQPDVSQLGVAPLEQPAALEQPMPEVTPAPIEPAPVQPQPMPAMESVRNGGSMSTTRTVRRNDIPPPPEADFQPLTDAYGELQAQQGEVTQQRQGYVQQQADAQAGLDDVESSEQLRQYAEAANQAQQEAHFSANRDARLAQKDAEIQQRMAEIGTVDPGRAWHQAGALGTAAGIISAAIGGYLAVRQGRGGNDALDQINKIIETDVHAQEQDIWNQKYKLGILKDQKEDIYKDAALTKAERAEQFAYRKLGIAAEMGVQAAKFKSASKQAEFLDMQAKLSEEAIKDSQEALKFYTEVYSKDAQMAFQAWQSHEQLRLSKEQNSISWMNAKTNRMQEERQAKGDAAEDPPAIFHPHAKDANGNQLALYVDPRRAQTMNKADFEKFDEKTATRYDLLDRANRIKTRAKELGVTFGPGANWAGVGSEKKAELDALYTDLTDLVQRIRSGAAGPESETGRYKSIVGTRDTFMKVDHIGLLDNFMQSVGGDQQRRADQLNLVDANGKPYNFRKDFKLPEFVDTKPTTMGGRKQNLDDLTGAVVAGVGDGKATADGASSQAMAVAQDIKDNGVSNPREATDVLRQLTVSAKALAEAGHTAEADRVGRLAAEVNARIAGWIQMNKAYEQGQQNLPFKGNRNQSGDLFNFPKAALPAPEQQYVPETFTPREK